MADFPTRESDCNNMLRPGCPGKTSWSELVGANGYAAALIIEKENRFVRAIVLLDGTPVTKDFRCDRVWVWVNKKGIVVRTPIVT